MLPALLRTKTTLPSRPADTIERPHLYTRLNHGRAGAITLLTAPAGYGKTTLVCLWIAHLRAANQQLCVGWYALDQGDNQPLHFLMYLASCIREAAPRERRSSSIALNEIRLSTAESVLTSLISTIEQSQAPYLLVLDDYHLIRNASIQQWITFLVTHAPPNLHLILATRKMPALPLARWQLQQRAVVLDVTDLRFTKEESADLLRQSTKLMLTDKQVEKLYERVEGWAVGLRLVALALDSCQQEGLEQFVNQISGRHQLFDAYLFEEVFADQPAYIQDFLLKTSILDRLTAPLCDALYSDLHNDLHHPSNDRGNNGTNPQNSQRILEELQTANLFTCSLDHEQHWYRYHQLFGDFLRSRQQRTDPARLLESHRRAGRWFAERGELEAAIRHALAAKAYDDAVTLIRQGIQAQYMQGTMRTITRWIEALPDAKRQESLQLSLDYAWTLLLTNRLAEAEEHVRDLQQHPAYLALKTELKTEQEVDQETGQLVDVVIAAIRASQAYLLGQMQAVATLVEESLPLLAERPESAGLRSVLHYVSALAELCRGNFAEADRSFSATLVDSQAAQHDYMQLGALRNRAFLRRLQGELNGAWYGYQQALALQKAAVERGHQLSAAPLYLEMAELSYERNELEKTTQFIRQFEEEVAQRFNAPSPQMLLLKTRLYLALGNSAAAQGALDKLMSSVVESEPSRTMVEEICLLVSGWLATGNCGNAHQWFRLMQEQPAKQGENRLIDLLLLSTEAQLLVAKQESARAAVVIQQLLSDAEEMGHVDAHLTGLLLLSLAYSQMGRGETALDLLQQALHLAAPHGYVRRFVDCGDPLRRLLQASKRRKIEPEYVARLLALFPALQKPSNGYKAQTGVAALSAREQDVVRLLAQGLSNKEIAEVLHISPGTITWHTKNVYRKLGVRNRTEAAELVRTRNLV